MDPATAKFSDEAQARLTHAEQTGLRLALGCRSAVTGAAFIWYVFSALVFPEISPRVLTITVLLAFTAIGAIHFAVIGTAYDRAWIKYAVYALDSLAICATFALVPISRADDIPQIIAFRSYGIYFLFPLLAMACLSLSWRLVLWTGGIIIVGWWSAFFWVVAQMDTNLSWSDMPSAALRTDYETVFLSMDFIGRGNRIEESAMVFFAALALAVAVYRARAVFFAQVAADVEWRRERSLRERVSNLLGKYVPEAIAQRLISSSAPLEPQRSFGTVLVMDIAAFTTFSAQHAPEHVIRALDRFLTDATQAVSDREGIVISYLGDGFLVTFNAPVDVETPERAAIETASHLLVVAKAHRFGVRIGIASGALVTGVIGNDRRQSFTVYGDPVNLASRLEGKAKELEVVVLMDDATFKGSGLPVSSGEIYNVEIAGLKKPVPVYALSDGPSITTAKRPEMP